MLTMSKAVAVLQPTENRIIRDEPIANLLTDSRSIINSEQTLFIALVTPSGNGHIYIRELYQRGIRNFLISEAIVTFQDDCPEANFISVRNTLVAMQELAAYKRAQFHYSVIGITGSNGKTVVKEFLYQLLHHDFNIVRSPKSYNSQLGVPLSVWNMSDKHDLGIFEAGISKPGEMSSLREVINPDIVVITGIGSAHQENFSSFEEKLQEKLLLARYAKQIVYDADNMVINAEIERSFLHTGLFGWSRKNEEAPLFIKGVHTEGEHTEITFKLYKGPDQTVAIPFTDKASIEDVIHCIAVTAILKPSFFPKKAIYFSELKPIEMRLELKNGYQNNSIINDSYSNDLMSLEVALDFQQRKCKASGARPVVILTDIYESGLEPDILYRKVATLMRRFDIQYFIGVGYELMSRQDLFSDVSASFFPSTSALLSAEILGQIADSCILIKGARRFSLETVSDRLVRQLNQTALEIDLTALKQNVAHYRAMIPSDCKMVCMIKAEGYGLGAFEMARTLEEANVDYLAVAVTDEGKYLRQMGIRCPILIMNPEINSWDTLIEYDLQPEIYSLKLLNSFCDALSGHQQVEPYPVHIKCDTGMHRLGFMEKELPRLCEILVRSSRIKVHSIFSHLAGADDPALDAFTQRQIDTFIRMSGAISHSLPYKPLLHILNTAGIQRFSQYHFDMVRLGIGLYGIDPVTNGTIHAVAKLTSTVLQIKELPAGEHIGYSCRGVMKRAGRIAIIPIGYADGFSRKMGNGALEVYINGVACPTIGNICMDTCMIDITDVPELTEGTRITLFGSPEVPLQTVAKIMDTIPYEVLTGLSPRIQRIYFQ